MLLACASDVMTGALFAAPVIALPAVLAGLVVREHRAEAREAAAAGPAALSL